MADLFTRIEIEEPSEQTALAIARHHAARLSAEFGLRIEDRVVERTVALASTFILNECHPAKSIRILQRVH
jgi:ATP-dependent Clp protease ATP-binding subunit ClpA